MSHDESVSPNGPEDIEAIRQFWDAALRRIKAYAETGKAAGQPTIDAIRDSDALSGDGGSFEGDGG